ncbi:alpha/beta hydrolase [soil metagenome]|jgi:pimeloyl-ACP methyl ester carboxylesterase|nr:alpha/beta hydrolase [Acidobacteriota bacterium]
MNLSEWQRGGNYFEYQDLPIFYRLSKKSDEVLLCLHGFPTSSHDYHKIWDALTEKFAVLAFDMIGYGFSAKPVNFDYATFNQVDILQNLLESLQIKKVQILAHDYGNTMTQELLSRAEEKRLKFSIETICFMNGALFPETHRPILAQKILISPFGFLFGRLISDSKFKQSLASIFGKNTQPNEKELDEFLQVFKFNNGRKIAHKLIRYMTEREKYRERWVGALQNMEQPFRFINGLADRVSGAHLVKRFREVVPHQTDIVELAEIGHFPHFEVPEIVLEKLFEFLESNAEKR